MTDSEWIKEIKTITDPVKMLRTIIDNEQYFGFDPYYKDIREAILKQAEYIVEGSSL